MRFLVMIGFLIGIFILLTNLERSDRLYVFLGFGIGFVAHFIDRNFNPFREK